MGMEAPSRRSSEQQDAHVKTQQEAERQASIAEYNAQVPEELTTDSLARSRQIQDDFHGRMMELSRARNERSDKAGTPQDFTPEERQEWDARSATWAKSRDLFEQASKLAGLKESDVGLTRANERHSGQSEMPRTRRNSMYPFELSQVKDPEKLAQVAELHRQAREELENFSLK